MKKGKIIGLLAVAALSVGLLAACSSGSANKTPVPNQGAIAATSKVSGRVDTVKLSTNKVQEAAGQKVSVNVNLADLAKNTNYDVQLKASFADKNSTEAPVYDAKFSSGSNTSYTQKWQATIDGTSFGGKKMVFVAYLLDKDGKVISSVKSGQITAEGGNPGNAGGAPAAEAPVNKPAPQKVVYQNAGNLYPITANNAIYLWGGQPAVASGHVGNCSAFAWQYTWDTYGVNVPYDILAYLSYAPATLQKSYAALWDANYKPYYRTTPAVGEWVIFMAGTQFYTAQKGVLPASTGAYGSGHVGVVTAVNPDGTFTMRDGGAGAWGQVSTNVKVVSGPYAFYDFTKGIPSYTKMPQAWQGKGAKTN